MADGSMSTPLTNISEQGRLKRVSTVTDVDGDRFAWRESGPGTADPDCAVPDSPVLVLLPGLGGSRLSWEPQLQSLATGIRVIAWDMPGYGASPALDGPVTFTTLADSVVDLFDELQVDAAHLAGISFGGMIAQYVAARYPSRVLTLTLLSTSPAFGLDGTKPDEWRAARLAPLDEGREPADFAGDVLAAIAGPDISPDALHGQRAAMARVPGSALRTSIDCLVTHDSRALLPTISAPTLCAVGELDQETPVAYAFALADLIPHARLVVIPHAGHLVNVEAPDAVNQLLLEQVESAAIRSADR
jgi:pimeloyl-ACP methyl ester carboxylesterase